MKEYQESPMIDVFYFPHGNPVYGGTSQKHTFAMTYVKMYSLHEGYGLVGNTASMPWLGKI